MKPVALTQLQEDRALRLKMDVQTGQNSNGFLAAVILSIPFVYTRDIPIAGVSNKRIYINPDFIFNDAFMPEHRVFVLLHEALHIVYDHIGSIGKRDPHVWNIAGDFRINNDLISMGLTAPKQGAFDTEHKYLIATTDEIYDDLIKDMPTDIDTSMLGDILPPEFGDDTGLTTAEIIKSAVAIADMQKSWGNLPNNLKEHLTQQESRKVSWKELLCNIATKVKKSGINYKKFSRRHISRGSYLPRLESKQLGTVAIAWDTSISVSNHEIALMKGETEHLREVLNPQIFEILCFDTRIHTIHRLTPMESISELHIEGRGGTDLQCIQYHYESAKASDDVACLIIFSDLECQPLTEDFNFPVFWVCINNPSARVHIGELIHYNSNED